MGDFLTFIVFAGLFYMMMRHGCGAHAIHGKSEKSDVDHTDPVCGMKVGQTSGYGMMYQDHLYRFCSRDCLDRFDSDPAYYRDKSDTQEVRHE